MLLLATPAVLQRYRIDYRLNVSDKRRNIMSQDKGSNYKAYVFEESTRRYATNCKG